MKLPNTLEYADYLWRVREIAVEQKAWYSDSYCSLPVLAGGRQSAFVSIVSRASKGDDVSNPKLSAPYASVGVQPDGTMVFWRPVERRMGANVSGRRFEAPLDRMTPRDRLQWLLVYHSLLTHRSGPMAMPWSRVDRTLLADLRYLVKVLAERPFLSLYRELAPEFWGQINNRK
jgi:hypothetical protein